MCVRPGSRKAAETIGCSARQVHPRKPGRPPPLDRRFVTSRLSKILLPRGPNILELSAPACLPLSSPLSPPITCRALDNFVRVVAALGRKITTNKRTKKWRPGGGGARGGARRGGGGGHDASKVVNHLHLPCTWQVPLS